MAETTAELIAQGVDVTVTLSELEKMTLRQYEKIIGKGLNTFLEVGKALAEIRDRRLYRETHKTFAKYCKDSWDLSRGYADQQIGGYQTVSLLLNFLRSKFFSIPLPIGAFADHKGRNIEELHPLSGRA